MSAIGTGYDLLTSTFSPDGRIFQVEYAQKAVENSGTAIGMRGKDGVIFAVENIITSTLYEEDERKRIFSIDRHVGMTVTGLMADARQIVEMAQIEAANYRSDYKGDAPLKYLKDRISMYMHLHTLYGGTRPFGASVIMGAYEPDDPQLYCIDPSGVSWGYFGCAVGKAKEAAETEMENINLKEKSITELVKEAARIIYIVHDEVKDNDFELELSWIGEVTSGKHMFVSPEVFEEAESYAKAAIDDDSQ